MAVYATAKLILKKRLLIRLAISAAVYFVLMLIQGYVFKIRNSYPHFFFCGEGWTTGDTRVPWTFVVPCDRRTEQTLLGPFVDQSAS
jgi:hypothetical protein